MNCCREVIEPSVKLGRMITFLKLIIVVYFFLIIVDLFLFETGFFFMILIQILVLFIAISSKHFAHFLLFILMSFLDFLMYFDYVGRWFQIGFYERQNSFVFCFLVFISIFQIFCIYVAFQLYKQSKQEYRIKYGYAEGGNGEGVNNQNDGDIHVNIQGINNAQNNNNNNNNRGFVPFQGRGYAVGGN